MTKPLDQMTPWEAFLQTKEEGGDLAYYHAGEDSKWLAIVPLCIYTIPIYRPRPEWMP